MLPYFFSLFFPAGLFRSVQPQECMKHTQVYILGEAEGKL